MELPYDGDTDDPRQYCAHGTFIGSWWGPDYLCYYCETGESPPTPYQLDCQAFAKRLRDGRKDMEIFDGMTQQLSRQGFSPKLADLLIEAALANEGWEKAQWFCQRQAIFA